MARICFLNPFGTDSYDELIETTLTPALHGTTEVEIRHLTHAAAEHRLLRAQAPLGDRDHDGRGRGRARRVRCVRHRLLLRPRPDAMSRAREHPGDRPARSIGHAVAPVRPLVRGRHGSPQGGTRAARSGAPLRARGQLPLRGRHRLVRHRHGARPADRRQGHVHQGPGRVAQHGRRDRGDRLHDRVRLLRARRAAWRRRPRCALGHQPERDGGQAGRDVRRPERATKQYRISRVGYYQQHTSHDADEAAEIMELLTGHSATKPEVAP